MSAIPAASSAQWTLFYQFEAAAFKDCHLLGDDRVMAISEFQGTGALMESLDGGWQWTVDLVPELWLYDLHFVDENQGYAVGRDNNHEGGFVLVTQDGGKSWSHHLMAGTHGFYKITGPTPQVAYTCGYLGVIWKTTDGGANWTALYPDQPTDVFTQISFPTAEIGYAAAGKDNQAGTITHLYRTVDGGLNWTLVKEFSEEQSITAMQFTDGNTGYICSQYDGLTAIIRTTDGGQTWAADHLDAQSRLFTNILFTDANNGWAIGDKGLIVHTTNGGATWTDESFQTGTMLVGIAVHGNTAVAVGIDGTMLKRSLAPSGVAVAENAAGTLALSPNPLTGTGMLHAPQLRQGQQYSLMMYDMQGTPVRSFTGVADGTDIPVERGDLPAGSYFFRLLTGNEIAGRGRFIVQ